MLGGALIVLAGAATLAWINLPFQLPVRKACNGYAKAGGFAVSGHAAGWRDRRHLVLDLRAVSDATTGAGLLLCLHDVAANIRSNESLEEVTLARQGEPRVHIEAQAFKTAGYGGVIPWEFWEDIRHGAKTPAGRRFEFDYQRNQEVAQEAWLIADVAAQIDGMSQSAEIGDAILAEWSGLERGQIAPASSPP